MPTYKLGRDAVADLPGVNNDDIRSVTINASANQIDVTTFKATALTAYEYQAGLTDVTIDVVCTDHTATVGDSDATTIADITGMDAVVLEVREAVTPRGIVEYTVTYGLKPTAA